ncbi:uncharacterized protein K452DRAFT_284505 [Aplosporella prunicola CBS 121167]|uniref:Uncharacterized protein n=1 Tax=Aplosporella prunicola CBS 121167 TaxID=1176127 RepID=A0A6A6BQN6_9PEZI|nr:uncharacterized protein K452DRAFT_284505 [Aplosporella prunicola CBS 121167]KAF2145117.1 hypothetical protein K452DRAFT_284505 [Aplosporella prunicola CBS 121167]
MLITPRLSLSLPLLFPPPLGRGPSAPHPASKSSRCCIEASYPVHCPSISRSIKPPTLMPTCECVCQASCQRRSIIAVLLLSECSSTT